MKLIIKDLFIGLEFKIEREVDLPHQVLFDRITQELEALDYKVVEEAHEKILLKKGVMTNLFLHITFGIG